MPLISQNYVDAVRSAYGQAISPLACTRAALILFHDWESGTGVDAIEISFKDWLDRAPAYVAAVCAAAVAMDKIGS
jgi:hypothetical protein